MSLYSANHPCNFWKCQPNPPEHIWQEAIARALPCLGLSIKKADIDAILAHTLGEGRYGQDHWELGFVKRTYYLVKPFIPRSITRQLRRFYSHTEITYENWPVDPRYAKFLWEVLRQVMLLDGREMTICSIWPEHHQYAFCITHDVETSAGQDFVLAVADLEEGLGFRSLFNFVPERYKLDYPLMDELRRRGFEVGVHGLKHNGKLFSSKPQFMKHADRINGYLKEWGARGFRAELTHRHPEWMQALEVEYDLSFFDTDPFEPIPGGSMSIWPFFIGRFVELPYTLVQDHTLTKILNENSPKIWLEKVDFIEKNHGMALILVHPDYLRSSPAWEIYSELLTAMKKRSHYWHTLPAEVAGWWKSRLALSPEMGIPADHMQSVHLVGDEIKIIA